MVPFIIEVDSDLEDIVPGFLENRKKDILDLELFLKSEQYKEIERIGHKVSGSSGGYGFHLLGEISKKIEHIASKDEIIDILALEKLIAEFKDYVENVEVKFIEVD